AACGATYTANCSFSLCCFWRQKEIRNEDFSLSCCDPHYPAAGVRFFVRRRCSIDKTLSTDKTVWESVRDLATRGTRRESSERVAEGDREDSGAEEGMLHRELPGQTVEGDSLRAAFEVSEHRWWQCGQRRRAQCVAVVHLFGDWE